MRIASSLNWTGPRALLASLMAAVLTVFMACAMTGCGGNDASQTEQEPQVTLEVYAANSLSEAMDEAQAAYVEQHPDVAFADTQYEASGTLLQKMQAGAKPDVFISASKKYMESAQQDELVGEDAPFDLFQNDLVIVASKDSKIDELTLEQALSGEYSVVVGDDNVPAGTYAKQAFARQGCYTQDDGTDGEFTGPIVGKVSEADKVGSVCAYVDSGDVDMGFVYSSDVMRYGNVKVVCVVPSDDHKPIVYPAAVTQLGRNQEAAQAFLDWCASDPEAVKIWQKWGFELAADNG